MNIKQLKEKIANLPDDMEVFVSERVTEFAYGLVNSATVKEINFSEDESPASKVLAMDVVLILSEE